MRLPGRITPPSGAVTLMAYCVVVWAKPATAANPRTMAMPIRTSGNLNPPALRHPVCGELIDVISMPSLPKDWLSEKIFLGILIRTAQNSRQRELPEVGESSLQLVDISRAASSANQN